MTYINDKTYWTIADEVYKRDLPSNGYKNENLSGWTIVEPEGAMLHDTNGSGFDATVFYNEEHNQVIIGYRGTEPPDRPIWSVLTDWETDLSDVVGNRAKNLEKTHNYMERHKEEIASLPLHQQLPFIQEEERYQNNQFVQAMNLFEKVKEEYPTADISTTGHSLGGAQAEYVAIRNGVSSTSYNPPSIVHLLPDDLQEKVQNGDYLKTNVAYVHPGDTVGSGVKNADQHVGSTYYINSTFEEANRYETIPIFLPKRRETWWEQALFGNKWSTEFIRFPSISGEQSVLSKFLDSMLVGQKAHSMDHFSFDEDGNISNPLYTLDGRRVDGQPRVENYSDMMKAREELKAVMNTLYEKYGSAAMKGLGQLVTAVTGINSVDMNRQNTAYYVGDRHGSTIQLTPEELAHASRQMRNSLLDFASDTNSSIQMFQAYISTSESRSFNSIAYDATAMLERINRWYQESITDIADYIEQKRQDFVLADQS
ncbi:lipase family protein [Paenibacillus silvae]|uniref:Fungal lipase-type domain-containing protein n=1 Tax=Paenibacillus silvae TaxID=1325358 RepID=A0A2W6NBT5_9BACL|nr:hypothetical protein [Paenibacillus silvae]PZT53241.1 hypothetical protein DN757_23285 [Paenibacillus silvae]